MRRRIRVGAAAAAMIVLSACEEPGKTVRVPAPTTTSAAATTTSDPGQALRTGKLAEGMRIAEVLALPTAIDPRFVRHGGSDVLTSARLTIVTGHNNPLGAVAEDHDLLAGFVSQRSNGGKELAESEWLTHGVMRFPDPDTAIAAADEFAAVAIANRGMLQTVEWAKATLPGAPDTRFVQLTDRGRVEGMAFTPVRDYVVFTKVRTGSAEDLAAISRGALERQRPLLDSFTPTPAAELARLPYDPDGVYELSVGDNGSGRGAYRQHAALLFAEDQPAAVALYPRLGVSAMAIKGSTVYRATDAAAASELAGATATAIARAWDKTSAAAPDDVPGASCASDGAEHANSWVCVVTAGRYVGEVWAKSQDAAHRDAREQYRVLAAAR
ncbi:DUF7373 family lipoprotein [Nocardia neocaledoniensis]|uniref:DUF7373 family lipoprotein n=1 Tax=Nocardia neocaledoniensis TaxID=236511 RepID=UPI0024589AFD|nr:hypothetical protein [Nocardia neocaledoniensis]